jgi:hypothetical protein
VPKLNRNVTIAIISAVIGVIALIAALIFADDPLSLGSALGVVLLANAAVRLGMARQ